MTEPEPELEITDPRQISTEQAAARLGVKPETVYAYVSRGMLRSTRGPDGRSSRFDAAEVERLAARSQRGRAARGREPVIRTSLTLIRGGRLYYRGLDATELARTRSFESVAALLWTGEPEPSVRFTAPAEVVEMARAATAAFPPSARLPDRLRVIPAVMAAADPLRFNVQPEAVTAAGSLLLAAMVEALPLRSAAIGAKIGTAADVSADARSDARVDAPTKGTAGAAADDGRGGSLAARLWPRLTELPPSPEAVKVLDAALVLLADHDLAASTLAARVAASTRAHPYAVVAAALGALDGPLHGAASSDAYRTLADAIASGDPVAAYSERLRTQGRVEGFDHRLYPDGDPRARTILSMLDRIAVPPEVRAAADGLVNAARQRAPRHPNVDFALPLLAHAFQMTPDAGEVIFAVARTAGWIAHALEEYQEPAMRFRYHGAYRGPQPGGG